MSSLVGIAAGLGLATASGLRASLPLLLASLAARGGYVKLSAGMQWLAGDVALVALATATIVEVLAYLVPWVDNAVDTVATPAAVLAGVLATAAVTPELDPLLRWTVAVVGGGGAAGLVQVGTVAARLKSSGLTGGCANPLLALAELTGSAALAAIALVAPLVGLALVVALVLLAVRWIRRRRTAATHAGQVE